MNNLPDFLVQNPPLDDPQAPPPYRFEDVGIQVFPVLADGEKLQAVCDYFLNNVAAHNNSQFQIDPLMGSLPGIVIIELLRYSRMYSTAPGHEQLGYSQQNELLFSIPVVLKNLLGIPLAVGMFVPQLCVDETLSMITGREVVGFPKVFGKFKMPPLLSEVDGCKVSTLAVKTFSNNQAIDFQPLLQTRSVDFAALTRSDSALTRSDSALQAAVVPRDDKGSLPEEVAKPLWPFGPIDELYGPGAQFAVDERVLALLRQSAGANLTTYSMKQFRDAEFPNKACYQAIVEGVSDLFQFKAGGILPNTIISIYKYDSLKIIEQLGLDAQGTEIKPLFEIWYHANFNLKGLRNLTASAGVTGGRPPRDCLQLWATSASSVLGFYKGMAEAWLQAVDNIDRCGGGRDR